jgi:hypothetical protein
MVHCLYLKEDQNVVLARFQKKKLLRDYSMDVLKSRIDSDVDDKDPTPRKLQKVKALHDPELWLSRETS